VIIMPAFPIHFRILVVSVLILAVLSPGLLVTPAAAADIEMEGYFGETITFHGFSYVGDSVYLFLTGPGLPENGVTLTDISQRTDQGHFTVVDVDENQEWTYTWKTSRIESELDPGTYIVYVTNKPADLSHLGGESSYKTFSVYLKDSGVSKISIDAQHVYTRNPEDQVSTPVPAPSVNITSATPAVTSPPPSTVITPLPSQTMAPTTRAGTGPWAAVTALLCCVVLVSVLKPRL
jgi:hypothetical protein